MRTQKVRAVRASCKASSSPEESRDCAQPHSARAASHRPGSAGYALRRKGVVRGAAHIGLDIIPVVGTAKAVVELFTGDLIPDKKAVNRLS